MPPTADIRGQRRVRCLAWAGCRRESGISCDDSTEGNAGRFTASPNPRSAHGGFRAYLGCTPTGPWPNMTKPRHTPKPSNRPTPTSQPCPQPEDARHAGTNQAERSGSDLSRDAGFHINAAQVHIRWIFRQDYWDPFQHPDNHDLRPRPPTPPAQSLTSRSCRTSTSNQTGYSPHATQSRKRPSSHLSPSRHTHPIPCAKPGLDASGPGLARSARPISRSVRSVPPVASQLPSGATARAAPSTEGLNWAGTMRRWQAGGGRGWINDRADDGAACRPGRHSLDVWP